MEVRRRMALQVGTESERSEPSPEITYRKNLRGRGRAGLVTWQRDLMTR